MLRKFLTLFFLACAAIVWGQSDTTIYKIVEEMPRFPGCEMLDTTLEVKNQCAQTSLLYFFNKNIVYPDSARMANVEGTVVLQFVVEKDGYISHPVVLKDPGSGLGNAALFVANAMNAALKEASLTWKPGMQAGKTVRTSMVIPIKFKLQEPPDFVMVKRDSVWVVVDDSLQFEGGRAALEKLVQSRLKTPTAFKDSCKIGTMDLTVLVDPSGWVKVLDLADYWGLGFDFQFEAISAVTGGYGKWTPASRKGRQVPSSYEMTVTFSPDAGKCAQQIGNYERANALAVEGSNLVNDGKQEEGILKLNDAIALFPNNANFLYLRGQTYMNLNKMAEACADFRKVSSLVSLEMVNQLLPLICK